MSGSEQINLDASEYQARLHELWRRAWPREVPRQPSYPFGEIPLSEYFRRWARLQPDRPALIFYGNELTYAELDSLSDRMALLLASCGVERGDRVVVFLPNCPQFLIAFYGILKLGAVFVPVNPLYKTHEFAHQVVDAGAEIIIALDQLMDIVRAVADRTGLRRFIVTSFADVLMALISRACARGAPINGGAPAPDLTRHPRAYWAPGATHKPVPRDPGRGSDRR